MSVDALERTGPVKVAPVEQSAAQPRSRVFLIVLAGIVISILVYTITFWLYVSVVPESFNQ